MKVTPVASNMTEINTDKVRVLVSYETPVAYQDKETGLFYKTEKKWSVTTSRHINKWLDGQEAKEICQFFLDKLLS